MNTWLRTSAAALCLCALAACDNTAPPPKPVTAAEAPAPDAVPLAASPASDPSLPDTTAAAAVAASQVTAAPGVDDKASRPLGDLTKADESSAMPKAGQANTHSSPSLEGAKP